MLSNLLWIIMGREEEREKRVYHLLIRGNINNCVVIILILHSAMWKSSVVESSCLRLQRLNLRRASQ